MRFFLFIVPLAVVMTLGNGCGQSGCGGSADNGPEYVQHIEFPSDATLEEKVAMAAHLVPSERQLAWQRSELTAFLHFGINTFTDREWGNGREDPAMFNPEGLDAAQWVRTLKECGFTMVILTAKHHDGFCLWPTATTSHSVASSPWRGGRGDVVAEVAHACADAGMKFGVYLSPWDRNAECYGDSPRYNEFFVAQLTELLTGYGPIAEVWFDGACGEGPNGKQQVYDWDAYLAVIRRLQPEAVSAVKGEDVRWVGNEGGMGRETEWSATVITPSIYARAEENNRLNGVEPKSPDLGSRERLVTARELFWFPSEVDVSIRPGWFWHERENAEVKSLERLADIYFSSVGRNSVLLLNIPPDTDGLLNEADVRRLREFAAWREVTFADNRVKRGDCLHRLKAGESVEYRLKSGSVIDVVMLCEHIERGQRIERFTVEALTSEGWREVAHGTTVGNKRLLRIEPVEARALRVRIDECRAEALLDRAGAFLMAPTAAAAVVAPSYEPIAAEVAGENPVTLDAGGIVEISGFAYSPAGGEFLPETAVRYRVWVSVDGESWSVAAEGEFGNIENNTVVQVVEFPQALQARYLRMEGSTLDDRTAVVRGEELEIF
ncbi:MAG: alpha-L-fucosidase [Alistipes sp.]|nr:alpha-L-fucosidase [Alistipes sp.]